MENNVILLENIISSFVEAKNLDKELRPLVEQKIFENVRNQIVNLEITSIRMRAEKDEKERKKENSIIRAKTLILELIFMSFFIGMIVNQTTECLAFVKGQTDPVWFSKLGTTLIILFSFFMIGLFGVLLYRGKIDNLFVKKERL